MAFNPINTGTTCGDGTGDPACVAGDKINDMFAELYAGVAHERLDIKNTTFNLSASFRADSSGNLGWYVGTAATSDGLQVKAATVNKTTGAVGLGGATTAHRLALYTGGGTTGGAVVFSTSGQTQIELYNTSVNKSWALFQTTNGSNSDFGIYANSGTPGTRVTIQGASGNVGIGTATPAQKLDVAGIIASTSAFPAVYLNETDQSVDNKIWRWGSSNGTISLQTLSDDLLTAQFAVTFTRTGTTFTGMTVNGPLTPASDNARTLGSASFRWSVVYAGTGTINTSDAREKTPVRPFTEQEQAAARDLLAEIGVYQWLASIDEKGEDEARLHIGLTVQRAIEIMESHGLDPWRYGFICKDTIFRTEMQPRISIEQKKRPAPTIVAIEVIDGIPREVIRQQPDELVFDLIQVVGLDGEPLMREVLIAGEDGEPPVATWEPVLHPVPVMEEVTREVPVEIEDGERLGFRPDQLDRFMLRGMLSKFQELEA